MGERRFLELLLVIHSRCSIYFAGWAHSNLPLIQIEPVKQIITLVKPFKGIARGDHYSDKVLEMGGKPLILKDATLIPVANYKDLKTAFICDLIS